MLQRLHHAFTMRCWDWIVMWHAVTCRWFVFRDAPRAVVERWAQAEPARFDGYPEIQDAIGYAQAELSSRRDGTSRPTIACGATRSIGYSRCN